MQKLILEGLSDITKIKTSLPGLQAADNEINAFTSPVASPQLLISIVTNIKNPIVTSMIKVINIITLLIIITITIIITIPTANVIAIIISSIDLFITDTSIIIRITFH